MNDLKLFKHGQEGTHYACAEIANSEGETTCCGCNRHKCKDMTNTITQRLRERFKDKTVFESMEEYVPFGETSAFEEIEQFIHQELSSLFTKFEEEVIGADEEGYTDHWGGYHNVTTEFQQERNRFREELRQKLAELKKEYTGGEK